METTATLPNWGGRPTMWKRRWMNEMTYCKEVIDVCSVSKAKVGVGGSFALPTYF